MQTGNLRPELRHVNQKVFKRVRMYIGWTPWYYQDDVTHKLRHLTRLSYVGERKKPFEGMGLMMHLWLKRERSEFMGRIKRHRSIEANNRRLEEQNANR